MTPKKATGRATQKKPKASLSIEGHQRVMELLNAAEKSKYPEIRTESIKLAKQISKHERSQTSRLSPTLVAVLATLIIVVAVGACWYATLKYPAHVARIIISIVFAAVIIIIALYALLSGNLSESNFVRLLSSAMARVKSMLPEKASAHPDRLMAQSSDPGTDDENAD